MRASAPPQVEPRRAPPPPLWTLFCSGILVGMIISREIVRAYRVNNISAQRSANGAFDAPRSGVEPHLVHSKRAEEPGRGRDAETPWQIPWKGWKDILWRTYVQIGEDRLLAVAAGVVFYGLLAVFPAITALVSLYGLFASASAIGDQLSALAGILPQGAVDLLREQIGHLTAQGGRLSLGFIFGLGVALWSANAGMKAIIDALNVVYKEREKRSFVRLNLVSLAFTLAAIGALLVALGAVVVLPIALNYLGLENATELLFRLARWPLLLALAIVGLSVLYRLGPSRRQPRWQWISFGSVFAAVAWLISSALLSWYLASFANYNATYGSLGAGIGMLMWMWISSIVILLGAQLNSEIEHQTARDSTVHTEKPLGARGAVMADTVGKAQLRSSH
jgi:membrane protein